MRDQTERMWKARRSTGDRLPPVLPERVYARDNVFPTRRAAVLGALILLKVAAIITIIWRATT